MSKNNIYTKKYEVKHYDCNTKSNASIHTIMKFFTDIADMDYIDRGYTHKYLWDNGFVFLLSQVIIKIDKQINCDETITVETWEREVIGARMFRDFYVYNSNNEKIISATTVWILVNPETRKILKPEKTPVISKLYNETALEFKKIRKKENVNFIKDEEVAFSMLDRNKHLYNANYSNIIINNLPKQLSFKDVKYFNITFNKEAILGDVIKIYNNIDKNEIYTIGKVNDKKCFECEMIINL